MDFTVMLITCLVFSITLSIVFLFKNKVHTEESRIYSILLFSNLVGIILEISCKYLSNEYIDSMFYDIILHTYFIYILVFLTMVLFYAYSLYRTESNKDKYRKTQIATYVALLTIKLSVNL